MCCSVLPLSCSNCCTPFSSFSGADFDRWGKTQELRLELFKQKKRFCLLSLLSLPSPTDKFLFQPHSWFEKKHQNLPGPLFVSQQFPANSSTFVCFLFIFALSSNWSCFGWRSSIHPSLHIDFILFHLFYYLFFLNLVYFFVCFVLFHENKKAPSLLRRASHFDWTFSPEPFVRFFIYFFLIFWLHSTLLFLSFTFILLYFVFLSIFFDSTFLFFLFHLLFSTSIYFPHFLLFATIYF